MVITVQLVAAVLSAGNFFGPAAACAAICSRESKLTASGRRLVPLLRRQQRPLPNRTAAAGRWGHHVELSYSHPTIPKGGPLRPARLQRLRLRLHQRQHQRLPLSPQQ